MKYLIFVIVVVLILALVYIVLNKKKKNDIVSSNNEQDISNDLITVNYLPEAKYEQNQLIEIKDKKVLATIDKLVVDGGKTVESIRDTGKTLYEVVIPKGAKLVNSKDPGVKNAVRGIYRDSKGIKGHANLVKVENAQAVAASAMNVASMVVGQYYMAEINNQLETLNSSIEKVSSFQNNEYKSKIMSIFSQVKKITSYESEILENDQLRKDELNNLNRLEGECTQLLGQANLTIEEITKNKNLDYDQYESKVKELSDWHMYQGYLLDILENIAKLKYALYLGESSMDMCFNQFNTYKSSVQKSQQCLINWHSNIAEKLKIELDSERIKKAGLQKFLSYVPGLFNDDLNYKDLPNNLVSMIKKQSYEENDNLKELPNLYNSDLRIVHKDNKTYFISNNE